MLRKEILGTKVRTESGLNKPLTLVKPNNDEDYKNLEFLDTDILLAKDIKRFVKGGESVPTLPEFSSDGNVMYLSTLNSKYLGFCYYTDSFNARRLNSIGGYLLGSGNDTGFYKTSSVVKGTSSKYYKVFPMFDFIRDQINGFSHAGYILHNIHGILANVLNTIDAGYYRSDGTVVSTESLKLELGISGSTSDTTQSIISYMNKNNDTDNRVVVRGRSDFAMCVYGGSDVSNMYIGNYVFSSTHDYENYYVPVGDNKDTSDDYIFPMVDCILVHESGVYNHYCYNLRNITGIKSDDGNIGYYRSDGNITYNVSFEPLFQIDGSNNPSGPWVGISYDGTGINAYAFTSGEITICPFENPANEPILSYTLETMCTGSKLKFEVTLNNIEHIVSRYNAGEDKVYATDGSIYDLGKLIDDIENTLIDITNRIAALEAKL